MDVVHLTTDMSFTQGLLNPLKTSCCITLESYQILCIAYNLVYSRIGDKEQSGRVLVFRLPNAFYFVFSRGVGIQHMIRYSASRLINQR